MEEDRAGLLLVASSVQAHPTLKFLFLIGLTSRPLEEREERNLTSEIEFFQKAKFKKKQKNLCTIASISACNSTKHTRHTQDPRCLKRQHVCVLCVPKIKDKKKKEPGHKSSDIREDRRR